MSDAERRLMDRVVRIRGQILIAIGALQEAVSQLAELYEEAMFVVQQRAARQQAQEEARPTESQTQRQ